MRFVSNLQEQALLNQLVPRSDNIIADENKRDLQLLDCLAQPPLQPVRHIRVDVQDGNRCLAKTPLPFQLPLLACRTPGSFLGRLAMKRTPSVLPVPGGPMTRTAH